MDDEPPRRANVLRRLYAWTQGWAVHPSASWALFAIAFAESSFFPIPPDVLLIALCGAQPHRALWFAAVCVAGSVLGGMLGYLIGFAVHDPALQFLRWISSQPTIDTVERLYNEYAFWALIVKAFTPIPYKVFTIAAGIFRVNFGVFVAASIIGRGTRFFMVSSILYFAGPKMQPVLEKYLEACTAVLLLLIVGGFVAIKYLA